MADPLHVLVVAAGDLDTQELVDAATASGDRGQRPFIVAADGGADRCLTAGIRPDLVVGDFDSLEPDQRARLGDLGVELRAARPDKDESDTELSLLTALASGATRITVVGALGIVRPEHAIANLLLLADPRLDGADVAIVARGSRIWRIGTADGPGEAAIDGASGDFVSLFPMAGGVDGVTTDGLRFPLRDEALPLGPSRGLSNELLGASATVRTRRGRLLVVHTASAQADGHGQADA